MKNHLKTNTFCIGNTCINEDHLKILIGDKNVGLSTNGGFMHKEGGTGNLVFWGGSGSAVPFKLIIV